MNLGVGDVGAGTAFHLVLDLGQSGADRVQLVVGFHAQADLDETQHDEEEQERDHGDAQPARHAGVAVAATLALQLLS